jgi:hypothetical protein
MQSSLFGDGIRHFVNIIKKQTPEVEISFDLYTNEFDYYMFTLLFPIYKTRLFTFEGKVVLSSESEHEGKNGNIKLSTIAYCHAVIDSRLLNRYNCYLIVDAISDKIELTQIGSVFPNSSNIGNISLFTQTNDLPAPIPQTVPASLEDNSTQSLNSISQFSDIDSTSIKSCNAQVVDTRGNLVDFKINGKPSKVQIQHDNPLKIQSGNIVESIYDHEINAWIPIRIRYDKQKPNFQKVAQDVYEDIKNPIYLDRLANKYEPNIQNVKPKIKIDELIKSGFMAKGESEIEKLVNKRQKEKDEKVAREKEGGTTDDPLATQLLPPLDFAPLEVDDKCLTEYNSAANVMKRQVIEEWLKPEDEGGDFGSGKWGDMHKYNSIPVKTVWGFEPNPENLAEGIDRLKKKRGLTTKFHSFPYYAQQSAEIAEALNYQKLDFWSSFFSLSFFFESADELSKLCTTVASNLKVGGYFIGTTIDGERLYELLKGKSELNVDNCFRITKYYSDDSKNEFGEKINIHLANSIVTNQDEWLVWFDLLVETFGKFGLRLIKSEYFVAPPKVDSRIKPLFECYRKFAFVRELTAKEQQTETRGVEEQKRVEAESENELSSLKVDAMETLTTKLPLSLTRVGTVADGSCYFHALLYLIDPRYRELSSTKRKTLVRLFRQLLSEKISRKSLHELGRGELILYLYTSELNRKNIKFNPNAKLEDIRNEVDANGAILESVFQKFVKNMRDCKVWVGMEDSHVNLFEYISNIFGINIYIIRDTTQKLYTIGDCSLLYKSDRPSVVVLWVGESHYEAVMVNDEYIISPDSSESAELYKTMCD